MPPDYRVISIGTLAAHPLWHEQADVRTGHATTTLITADDAQILVNPALPAAALGARLGERSQATVASVTHVFLTCFQPDHRRALLQFEGARWLMQESEIGAARETLDQRITEAEDAGDEELIDLFRRDREVLEHVRPAPDSIVAGVDLFPMPGVTPGTCGLLLALPAETVLVCGDAVATIEHLQQGKVLPTCSDVEQAQESFREALEIADVLIPGRDNVVFNPLRRTM